MERYYENLKSFELDKDDLPIEIEFDEAAFNMAFETECRESYERYTGMKYEDAGDGECDFSGIYAAEAASKASKAAAAATRTPSRLLSKLKDDLDIDFDTFQPSTTRSSPSKPTIKASKPLSHSSSRDTSTPPPFKDGMPPLLSPSIHILALLVATTITLIRHGELARFVLYWLARAVGIDLAAWPSTVHLLPAAFRDTTPDISNTNRDNTTKPNTTQPNITKPNTPETNTRRGTTTTRHPPSRYWTTLHALRWQEGLSEPVISSLQSWYIVTLILLLSTCSTGTGEAILAAVWTALLWPVLQSYLLVVVVTSGVRWAPELLWFAREVVWFGVWAVGVAVVEVVRMWVAVLRATWVVVFVTWAAWVGWGLVSRVSYEAVGEGTAEWVLYRGAELLYWAGDVVRDVARGVMLTD